jgi:xylitol oxidase
VTQVNWAGNYSYRAERLHRPSSLEQVREIVAAAPRVRVLGTRHSFNDIADSSELMTLAALPTDVVVDRAAGTVSFGAGTTYGALAEALNRSSPPAGTW